MKTLIVNRKDSLSFGRNNDTTIFCTKSLSSLLNVSYADNFCLEQTIFNFIEFTNIFKYENYLNKLNAT